jgi:hypothetical protein
MPLSISKLYDLLTSKGFVPNKYFVMDGLCFYIELISIQTANTFLLYIPTKYKFIVPKQDSFKIKYINMDPSDNTTDEYAGFPDNTGLESSYGDANINLSPDKNDKLEEHLEDNYKHTISLKDISKDDIQDIKSIYRQMRRLRYCVQNIKYKVGIIDKNYICAIRRDDSIDTFTIKHYPRKSSKRLMVIMDLEMFYEKNERLNSDIETVRIGIYNILQKNQSLHTKVISKLLDNKDEITSFALKADIKKTKYDKHIKKLEIMLHTMNKAEKKNLNELDKIMDNKNNPSMQGMNNDIQFSHHKARVDKELSKIGRIKEDIMININIMREKRENNILSIDKIMFDNTVMFDCMVKNFSLLKGFC